MYFQLNAKDFHSKWLNWELSPGKGTETLLLDIILKLDGDLDWESLMLMGEGSVCENVGILNSSSKMITSSRNKQKGAAFVYVHR